ncbi:MAG: pilus assembly PilX N-terminal domain-containing protein [Desulfuromonadales bacterium]
MDPGSPDGTGAQIRTMCGRKSPGERGVALISVILLILVLSFISATTIVTSITELKIGANFKTAAQSFYNAEAGVQYALGQIKNRSAAGTLNITGSPFVLHYSAPDTVVYPLLSNGSFPFSNWTTTRLELKSGSTTDYTFQLSGYYANSNTRLQAIVRMPAFTLVQGAFMSGAVSIGNNLSIVGTPAAQFGSNTSLSTGNTDFTTVVLGGSASYAGSAAVSHVSPITPDPLGAAALVSTHNYSASNNNAGAGIVGNTISGSKILSPGNYYLTNITNGNLTINGSGAVNLYVATSLSLTSITINSGSGPVSIYYHGTGSVSLAGATLNSGGSAGNLMFFCDTGLTAPTPTAATTFDFQSNPGGTYSALFYAPYADFIFKDNDYMRGMLWGKTLTAQTNFKFQYDETAATYFGSAAAPALISWKQL